MRRSIIYISIIIIIFSAYIIYNVNSVRKLERIVPVPITFQELNEDDITEMEQAPPPIILYYISPSSKLAGVPGCHCEEKCTASETSYEEYDYRFLDNVQRKDLIDIIKLFHTRKKTADGEKSFLEKECNTSDYLMKIYLLKDTGKIFSIQAVLRTMHSSQILEMLREKYGKENYEQHGIYDWYGEYSVLSCMPLMKEIQIFYLKNFSDWIETQKND